MPSRSERLRGIVNGSLRLTAALAMAVLPPAVLARLLGAEGPRALLATWSGFVVVLAGTAIGRRPEGLPPRRLAYATGTLAAILGGSGVLVALVQLNVARRSLAEAWLDLARRGEAFGFFSFFAAELYALFCLGAALLCLARRPLAALAALVSSTAFAAGVIGGDGRWLAAAIVTAAAVPALAGRARSGPAAFGRLRSAIPPAVVAVLAALPFAFLGRGGSSIPLLRPLDLTPLVRSLVPSFPLLLDVPGYGFEIGASRLAPNIYLSDGVLFEAEGEPGLHYIVSSVYSDWSEGAWRESAAFGRTVSVERRDSPRPRPAGALRLRLDEDFYSLVPVERRTATVTLMGAAPETEKATQNQGVRFSGVARRGLVADLENALNTEPRGEIDAEDGPGGRWVIPGIDDSGRIAALARSLGARAEGTAGGRGPERDRAVIQAILDYFKEGYAYALNVRGGEGEVALERFLFEERKGYCLHYATAFVLLARHVGISARVVEGFRLSLGETGRGTVKGVDAHAWAEAWVDGAWRVFEPTPPFASPDPFAYLAAGDPAARRQLETLFGRPASVRAAEPEETGTGGRIAFLAALSLAAAIAAAYAARHAAIPRGSAEVRAVKRRAAALVRYAKSFGLAGPETLGWTGWARAVAAFVEGQGKKEGRPVRPSRRLVALRGAEETADRMIALTFDVESR